MQYLKWTVCRTVELFHNNNRTEWNVNDILSHTVYTLWIPIYVCICNFFCTGYSFDVASQCQCTEMSTSDEFNEAVGSSSVDNNEIPSFVNALEGAQSGQTSLSLAGTETGYTEIHQGKNSPAFAVTAENISLALPKKGNLSTVCAVHCSVNARWCMLGNYSTPFCGGLLQHYSV